MSSRLSVKPGTKYRHCLHLFAMVCGLAAVLFAAGARAQAPGGIVEMDDPGAVRAPPTATQIAAFMSTRGTFTFPAPWNTRGVRITNASDCGGQDCVSDIYSYWRNMSNSAGSNIMYIVIGLDRTYGGLGPTLFQFDKTTEALTKLGPLFPDNCQPVPDCQQYDYLSWVSTEGSFFSYSMPTKIYITDNDSKLLRYDVLTHQMETIFDVASINSHLIVRQAYASNDDNVFSATLERTTDWKPAGCLIYTASTQQFTYFAAKTSDGINECQVDKSGRYVLIVETLPTPEEGGKCPPADGHNVVEDLQTGTEQILCKQDGAGGHYALGYGWMIEADSYHPIANKQRAWDLSQPLVLGSTLPDGRKQGAIVYHGGSKPTDWVPAPLHVSWENAVPSSTTPIYLQYGCGGSADADDLTDPPPRYHEIECFLFDSSIPLDEQWTMVIAPSMSNLDRAGGRGGEYSRYPKGNLDPTGHYFFWTSNLEGDRLDAFMVEIPCQQYCQ